MKVVLKSGTQNASIKNHLLSFKCTVVQEFAQVMFLSRELSDSEQAILLEQFKTIKCFTDSKWPLVATAEPCPLFTNGFAAIAGPCSVESEQQINLVAKTLSELGVKFIRGGAFKPRTSPYAFQGLGLKGYEMLANAARQHDLISVSEVMSVEQIELASKYIDILQVGARNMQNYPLLTALGKLNKPIILKRSAAATYSEFLNAAEYILLGGNSQVILCERGIKSFEPMTRNTLDISLVPVLQQLTNLPIIIDPSHAVGLRSMVPALTRAAVAVGANGVMLEAHPQPELSVSDAEQALSLVELNSLLKQIANLCKTINCFENT